MWDERKFSDIKLVSADQQVLKAHKVVLCASSSYFRKVLYVNKTIQKLNVKVNFKQLQQILEFIYTGKYKMEEISLEEILSVGLFLGVDGFERHSTEAGLEFTLAQKEFHENLPAVNILKCEVCEYTTTRNNVLREHKRTKHGGLLYSCTECELKTPGKNYLKRHIKEKHNGLKYNCAKCDFSGRTYSGLHRHRKNVHENERFPCHSCEHKATTKERLHCHDLAKHTDKASQKYLDYLEVLKSRADYQRKNYQRKTSAEVLTFSDIQKRIEEIKVIPIRERSLDQKKTLKSFTNKFDYYKKNKQTKL